MATVDGKFTDPHISQTLTFAGKKLPQIFDLYAGIYGTFERLTFDLCLAL